MATQQLSPELFDQLRTAVKRPEGSIIMELGAPQLISGAEPRLLFQLSTGAVFLRLQMAPGEIRFTLASPSAGTRTAAMAFDGAHSLAMGLGASWRHDALDCQAIDLRTGTLTRTKGLEPSTRIRIGKDASVFSIAQLAKGITMYAGGKPVLAPTAIESWHETINAIEILHGGTHHDKYSYELVCCNLTLVMLATGLETYAKRRAVELEEEGIQPNTTALMACFLSKRERADSDKFLESARTAGSTPLQRLIEGRRINFQEYDDVRKVFCKAFGLRFPQSLGLRSSVVAEIKKYLRYRHSIVHVSPMLAMLNQAEVPPAKPDFPSASFARSARNTFSNFVEALHAASFTVRTDPKTTPGPSGRWRARVHREVQIGRLFVYNKQLEAEEMTTNLKWLMRRGVIPEATEANVRV